MAAIVRAYNDLCTCRQIIAGMTAVVPGPIPWTAIHEYAQRNGITDPDDFADFEALIRRMEAVDREAMNKTTSEGGA